MDRQGRGALIVLAAGAVATALRFWLLPAHMPGLRAQPPMAGIDYALVALVVTACLGIAASTGYHVIRALVA